jgi:hypothetical protein
MYANKRVVDDAAMKLDYQRRSGRSNHFATETRIFGSSEYICS